MLTTRGAHGSLPPRATSLAHSTSCTPHNCHPPCRLPLQGAWGEFRHDLRAALCAFSKGLLFEPAETATLGPGPASTLRELQLLSAALYHLLLWNSATPQLGKHPHAATKYYRKFAAELRQALEREWPNPAGGATDDASDGVRLRITPVAAPHFASPPAAAPADLSAPLLAAAAEEAAEGAASSGLDLMAVFEGMRHEDANASEELVRSQKK